MRELARSLIFDTVLPGLHNEYVPNVIIFDLDDTIVAWDAVAAEVWLRVCREAGKDEPLDMDQIAGNIRQT
ncbi:MAG: hypothetical protein MUO19_03910, partial [Dehalococcoidales bacterium]|nr:hypothetical protein [Dehalococcoidales bacterium]